jgi:PAS domain S-box-containing protein
VTDQDLAHRILASAADFAIISVDRTGHVTSWNPGAENLLGWDADEMMGQACDRIFTDEDREAGTPANEMQVARDAGKSVNERWHVRRNGDRFWGSGLMMPLLDQAGSIDGFTKIMRDRTAERSTEQRYNALTAALPGLLFITDTGGQLTDTNALFQSYTGRSSAELDGDRWHETLHDDERDEVVELWRQSVRSGEPFRARYRLRDAEGNYRCFDCRATASRDEEGRAVRWMGTCLDVENDARARAALERLNVALEHRVAQGTDDLASAIEELQVEIAQRIEAEEALRQAQKMEAIGQLTGGVAHDFNNLLTVILGSAELLRRSDITDEKRHRYISAIVDTAQRASALIAQLLAFARRQPLTPELFDVGQKLKDMGQLLDTTLGPKVRYTLDIQCEPCHVLADPSQFDTAMLNLAVNARDAMEGEGRLTITVAAADFIPAIRGHAIRRGKFIKVTVDDSGPGISPQQADHVFEPFYTTKNVGKGTGLGLSQVHGFSKQSGGDITIEEAPGGGARFSLYLPSESGTLKPEAIGDIASSRRIGDGQGSVLIVEDNEMVGQLAADLLGDLGYVTTWAHDAAGALELLANGADRFDIVFSDIVMPGMSGIELAHRIRTEHPRLPIILTSGYSHVLADEGNHGFEVLRKPYSAQSLTRLLGRLLGATDGEPQNI